ncbi:MAG: hypothetical protein R3C49_09595 [Planctomycetaceae bacterium]
MLTSVSNRENGSAMKTFLQQIQTGFNAVSHNGDHCPVGTHFLQNTTIGGIIVHDQSAGSMHNDRVTGTRAGMSWAIPNSALKVNTLPLPSVLSQVS